MFLINAADAGGAFCSKTLDLRVDELTSWVGFGSVFDIFSKYTIYSTILE